MADVKTQPVQARLVPYAEFFGEHMRAVVPGSFCVAPDDEQEAGKPWTRWLYACPCGCGASSALRVEANKKPEKSPSWWWNGSLDAPVLSPSVHWVGHWHGFLGGNPIGSRPGWWVSC